LNDDGRTGILGFEHAILGDHLDAPELHQAVAAVGFTADRLDDELQARFGGKRLADL
jgi:hypothetical protein